MNTYRIYGTVPVDVYVDIEAPTMEDAIEYVRDNYEMIEYCNNSIGCEDRNYEFADADVTCCCDVEWNEDYSECIEEDVLTDSDYWDIKNED